MPAKRKTAPKASAKLKSAPKRTNRSKAAAPIDLTRYPGLEGFGEAAAEMAKWLERSKPNFGPGLEWEKTIDAACGVGDAAREALKGLEHAERAGNTCCAAAFRAVLEHLMWSWWDTSHAHRLICGDFRFPVEAPNGTFQIVFTGDRGGRHPEFLLMAALKKSQREWKER